MKAPPPAAAPPPPEPVAGAPGATDEASEKVPPFDADDGTLVYGYLGARPIAGRVSPKTGRWSGTFRFVGKREPFTAGGPVRAPESEDEAEPEPRLDGRREHHYLECDLDVGGAGITGVLSAACLKEGDTLEIRGTIVAEQPKGAPYLAGEPFFVRTPEKESAEQSRYYGVLAGTPTEPRGCAPFVEVLEPTPRPGRTTLLYTLRWPCEEPAPDGAPQLGFTADPQPVWRQAYVADVADEEPPRLLSSVGWTSLGDPDDPNDLSMELRVFDLVPGIDLYVATLSDDFQSPVSSGGSNTTTSVMWGVTSDGRYGPKLEPPSARSGHAGVCYASSATQEFWLVDVEGSSTPELVARMTEQGMTDKVVNGNLDCGPTKPTVTFKMYSFDPATLGWQTRPAPKALSERRLAAGLKLDVPP